jgi:hypothetical protein
MVTFTVEVRYHQEPRYIFDSFIQIEKWHDFKGFGMIPSIKNANFILKTDSIKGTIIQVENSDGSSHKEEIQEFEKDKYLKIKMYDFSRPLSYFAHFFIEEWALKKMEDGYKIERSMTLHSKGIFSYFILKLISNNLKNAIQIHTEYVIQEIDRYLENNS